jgi:hypothetical protein
MNATFCSNCGSKHPYTYAKPKFCSSCGTSLGAELKTAATKASVDDEYDDDFEDEDGESTNSNHVPRISKLQFDLEDYSEYQSFSLGSIFGDNSPPTNQSKRRKSQNLDDFVNEKPRRGE